MTYNYSGSNYAGSEHVSFFSCIQYILTRDVSGVKQTANVLGTRDISPRRPMLHAFET